MPRLWPYIPRFSGYNLERAWLAVLRHTLFASGRRPVLRGTLFGE